MKMAEKHSEEPGHNGPPVEYHHTDLTALLRAAQSSVDEFRSNEECMLALPPHNTLSENVDRSDVDKPEVSSPFSSSSGKSVAFSSASLESLYHRVLKIQAPMVRCSRPAFRKLCRLWGTDISYTHMIMAESFVNSPLARDADFALYHGEDKLIVQLASPGGPTAAEAAVWLQPYCDAIDINCGCPQKWAIQEGIGSAMLEKPERVADMVKCIRNAVGCGHPSIPCVVKMRVKNDIRESVDFARQCEAAGASWLTVHGRTPQCGSSAPVRWDSIRTIRAAVSIPLVANGGVTDPGSALRTALGCHAGGVMSGNGLLDNPAAFTVYNPHSGRIISSDGDGGVRAEWSFLPSPYDPLFGYNVLYPRHGGTATTAPAMEPEPPRQQRRVDPVFLPPGGGFGKKHSMSDHPLTVWSLPCTPMEVISDFIRLAVDTDLACAATIQHVLRMARPYLSPSERSYMALLRSNLAVMAAIEECGLYTTRGKYQSSPHRVSQTSSSDSEP